MKVSSVKAVAFSGAGTTLAITERFCSAFGVPAKVADITPKDADVPTFTAEDLAVFAVPAFGGVAPAPAAEKIARCKGAGTPAVIVVSYGNRAVDDTFLQVADIVSENGFVPVAIGSFVAHHSLMADVAVGRPDEGDLAAVDAFAHAVAEKLAAAPDAESARLADIPGTRPYRTFAGVPFKAEAVADMCVRCGACARQCPVGAIDPEDPAQTDAERCISCMRCISVCPAGARRVAGGEALDQARAAFAAKNAERKEPWTAL